LSPLAWAVEVGAAMCRAGDLVSADPGRIYSGVT
jgi:hypothetical protein